MFKVSQIELLPDARDYILKAEVKKGTYYLYKMKREGYTEIRLILNYYDHFTNTMEDMYIENFDVSDNEDLVKIVKETLTYKGLL